MHIKLDNILHVSRTTKIGNIVQAKKTAALGIGDSKAVQ